MKKYLKEMDEKELERLLDENISLQEAVANYMYEDDIMQQNFEYNEVLGSASKYFSFENYCASFYLELKDLKLIDEITEVDYFTENTKRLFDDAVSKKKLFDDAEDAFNNLDVGATDEEYNDADEKREKLYNDAFASARAFLKSFENQLHEYEEGYCYKWNKDIMKSQFTNDVIDLKCYNEHYIIDDDYTKVYQDITVINKF